MKILVLQSSPRLDGNTAHLVTLAESSLKASAASLGEPLEIETIHLVSMKIQYCAGCRICFDKGESFCPHKDDLPSIKAKMKESDGLLLAGPVFVDDVNAIMKNWIDRLAHVCHRPEFWRKTAVSLASTGKTPARHALRTMRIALWTWGYRIVGAAWFPMGARMSEDETRERYGSAVDRVAGRLVEDIRARGFRRPSFLSLFVFRIQQAGWRKAPLDSID